ncbi:MAG: arylsulfatase, partial [Bacteroidales bacterium]|nr:arylsulfatase [Bacteroidales bacterium]
FTFALRQGDWKYIQPLPDGKQVPGWFRNKDIESGLSSEAQLYDLSNDLGELDNIAGSHPLKVEELNDILEEIMKAGKSRTD